MLLVALLGLVAVWSGCSSADNEQTPNAPTDRIPVGASQFIFDEYPPLADKPLTVWTFRPDSAAVDEMPIVFVMHGFGRKAEDYRDAWVPHARAYNVLVVVPTFGAEDFPGGDGYNLGSIFTQDGEPTPEDEWAFSAIEPLFDHVASITDSNQDSYYLYGHSAGSQFAHRFLLFKPENRAHAVVAANAGWYTMPHFNADFPYGLNGSPSTPDELKDGLAKNLIVLLGEDDNNPNAGSLRTTPEAMVQGEHRLARGRTFYRAAEEVADSLDVPFNWTLQTVPGVGHDNEQMAAAAAERLFGRSAADSSSAMEN
jgi:pimeloyl-ACP methyl ester carboxylesterase